MEGGQALVQADQGRGEVSILGDIQSLTGHSLIRLLQLMVVEQGLDRTTSRSACQLQIFLHTVTP